MMEKVMSKILSFLMVVCLSFSALADGATVNEYMGSGIPAEGAKLVGETRGAALAATGTTQGTGYAIINSVNVFTTVTTSSADSAKLPTKSVVARDDITVVNNGAGILQVFPPTSGAINKLSTNSAFLIGTGGAAVFKRISSTGWSAAGQSTTMAALTVSGDLTVGGNVLFTATGQDVQVPAIITPTTNLTPVAGARLSNRVAYVVTAAPTAAFVFIQPTLSVGKSYEVYNQGANPLPIIPEDGTINLTGALTPYVCATGKYCACTGLSTSLASCSSK